jgi:hypothetical protein
MNDWLFFFFKGFVFKSRLHMDLNFESLMIDAQDAQELPSIDVIIPTLGRKVFI